MQRSIQRFIVAAICVFVIEADGSMASDLFEMQVAPIFQTRCLSCHSGDQPKGGYSLETAEATFAAEMIEPGDASSSHLMNLIELSDGKAEMPRDADPLSENEIAAIRNWIDDGAKWPEGMKLTETRISDFNWWSYQPLNRPQIPHSDDRWATSPVDAFVLEALRRNGLTHAAPADRRTLIRRVTFDLTGLPPTFDEVEAFANDTSPQAYERLVDRLLESNLYGERWAQHWLDVVKYADTHGYDKDKLRHHAWPYRDYVIRSLNEDKPYARFVQEQMAGDVLFPGQPDGILGLGFIAAGPWDFIGHVEVSESKLDGKVARDLDRDDMVSNAINTFCSVTVQCARCHNHKFDPITQQDYYGMQSLLASIDRADRVFDTDPETEAQRKALSPELASMRRQESQASTEIAEIGGPQLAELEKLIPQLRSSVAVVKDPKFGYHSETAQQPDEVKWVEVDLDQKTAVAQIVLHPCHDDFANIGAGFGFPVRFRVDVFVNDRWETVFDQTRADFPNPGLSAVEIKNVHKTTDKVRVTVTRLADRQDVSMMAIAELRVLNPDGINAALHAKVTSLDSIEAPVRWGRENLTDGLWAQAEDLSVQRELADAMKERDEILAAINTPERAERNELIRKSIQETQAKLNSLPEGQLVYAAATHFAPEGEFKPTEGKPRAVHVLHRGNVDQPQQLAIPGFLPLCDGDEYRLDVESDDAQRRSALALWLTDEEHPLVWRSIVNRIWQHHFGRGIVETPNDFGRMGATPTHPELLDWLAVEFRDGGQSMKSLHRMIVTSNAYRQTSQHSATNAFIDGSNQYLWRANRRRLEAEEIRDSILAVSGALNPKAGGPGFYLFDLEKTEHSPHYEYHLFDPSDPASHRRSIYRFVVRSQPDPWMTTLDCADSSQSTPRRGETLTSLQALALLNNSFNLEMSQQFASRLEQDAPELASQVRLAVKLALQREPTETEQAELVVYARTHGLANMCRILFNFSEFVFVD